MPPPIDSFKRIQDEFSLAPVLVQNLQASGYTHPTPIQMQAVPIMLQVWICFLDVFSDLQLAAKNEEKCLVYTQRRTTQALNSVWTEWILCDFLGFLQQCSCYCSSGRSFHVTW